MSTCVNRLIIVGLAREVTAFDDKAAWMSAAGARHPELLEHSPGRHAWQFETDTPPLKFLRIASRCCPHLVFLLDYDREAQRLKGLVRAKNGRLRHYRVRY
jgi:hypothetical protein